MSYLDNAPVESNNGSIRRHVKSRVQVKAPELQDIQGEWVRQQSLHQRRGLGGTGGAGGGGGGGGDSDSSSDSESEDEMQGGGGGRCRAWISAHRDEFQLPNNKIDLIAANRASKKELEEHPESEDMQDAHERGQVATKAARTRFESDSANYDCSVFGTLRPMAQRRLVEIAE
jgi:hypothetical protein